MEKLIVENNENICIEKIKKSGGDETLNKLCYIKEKKSVFSPSTLSSITHVHRCIGYHNPNWHSLSKPTRLTNLSVHDNRDGSFESTPSPFPPSSLMIVHRRSLGYHNPN